jgi:D-glycero-D-manno-heptose 1,7-bisphosphate phosphatase
MNKAVFFDRDGIVNVLLDNAYVRNPEEFTFIPEFFEFYKSVKKLGFLTIIITNQQGIGKGIMTDEDLELVHDYMQNEMIKLTGSKFDDIFSCGELHAANSNRRKPNPGMFLEAIEKWDIDVKHSIMIGDSERDAEGSDKVGIKSILIGEYDCEFANHTYKTYKEFLADAEKILKEVMNYEL